MSTTATVTPYDPELEREIAEESPRADAAVERYRDEQRAGRIRTTRIALRMRTVESFVQAAESIGYRREVPTASATSRETTRWLSLRKHSGEVLVLEKSRTGRLVVNTHASRAVVQEVVRQHTLTQAISHLQSRGMEVNVRQQADGQVQIVGRERAREAVGGRALVAAGVRVDGSLHVDIGCVKGQRCEQILINLAHAVSGEATDMKRKVEFFQTANPSEVKIRA